MSAIPLAIGRPRTQGMLLLLVAFVVGALAGAALDRRLAPERRGPFGTGRFGRGARGGPVGVLRSLDLTPDQCSKVDAVLAHRRPQMDSIMRETVPRMRVVADSLRDEVRAILTPDQLTKLDKAMPNGDIFGPRGRNGAAGAGPPGPDPGPDGAPNVGTRANRPMQVCSDAKAPAP